MTSAIPIDGGATPAGVHPNVPLAVWAIVLLGLFLIPLKIISYGYLPADDALRHAAKAVSGKSWPQILVLKDYKVGQEFGWECFLRGLVRWDHLPVDTLVMISVAGIFLIAAGSALPLLKFPEAWLATLILMTVTSDVTMRFLIGRPFALSIAALIVLLTAWRRRGAAPVESSSVIWMTGLVAFAVFMHGVWYLWALPIAAFFLARQFRGCLLLAASWAMGTVLGSALTGRPIAYAAEALTVALRALGAHLTQRTLVAEFRATGGDFFGLLILAGVIALRQLARLDAPPLARDPAFWLAAIGWALGCQTARFWDDWGAPALMTLVAGDLQILFEKRLSAESIARLAWAAGLAAALYLALTSDARERWTQNLSWRFLSADNPDLKGWLPERGGILYSADMTIFYQTFYKNPTADWRYILGFEPTLMPDDDFQTYQRIIWNFGDAKAYQPWARKMRPIDRLVIRGGGGSRPKLPQLEWNYGVSGIWIGRAPRTMPRR